MENRVHDRNPKDTNDKEATYMPTMDMIEYERVNYVKEMQDYLRNLKNLNKKEAKEKSFQNLVKSDIISENGEFTERFACKK
ncbi:MAG: hypothetical protein ACOCN3_05125 [Roseburia inulinivorans]